MTIFLKERRRESTSLVCSAEKIFIYEPLDSLGWRLGYFTSALRPQCPRGSREAAAELMSQVLSVRAEIGDPVLWICWVNTRPTCLIRAARQAGNLLFYFYQGHQFQESPVLILVSSLCLGLHLLIFCSHGRKGYCPSFPRAR